MTSLFWVAALLAGGGGKVDWSKLTLEEALAEGAKGGKPVLAYFRADDSPMSVQQDAGAFSDDRVVRASESFIRALIDCSKGEAFAQARDRHRIVAVPTVLVVGPTGDRLLMAIGAPDPSTFLGHLEAALAKVKARTPAPVPDEREVRIRDLLDQIDRELTAAEQRLRDDLRILIRDEVEKAGTARTGHPEPMPSPDPTPVPPVEAKPAWLGLITVALTEAERKASGLPEPQGLRVEEVRPGGPSDLAGVKVGDVLTRLAGQPVTEERMPAIMATLKTGDTADAEVIRSGKLLVLKVVFTAKP